LHWQSFERRLARLLPISGKPEIGRPPQHDAGTWGRSPRDDADTQARLV
jgi:hypothetical protein